MTENELRLLRDADAALADAYDAISNRGEVTLAELQDYFARLSTKISKAQMTVGIILDVAIKASHE